MQKFLLLISLLHCKTTVFCMKKEDKNYQNPTKLIDAYKPYGELDPKIRREFNKQLKDYLKQKRKIKNDINC